jgi:hypothetical protein
MNLKRRLLPIAIALSMVAILFISWTPNWESAKWLRSEKPYVTFQFNVDDKAPSPVKNLALDISNRLDVRHEWHRVESGAEWHVAFNFKMQEGSVQIDTTLRQQQEVVDHIIVRGGTDVTNALAGRMVDLLTERIKKHPAIINNLQ